MQSGGAAQAAEAADEVTAFNEEIEVNTSDSETQEVSETTGGYCGENVKWSFDSSTGTLTISGTGKMEDYDSDLGSPWHEKREGIKEIVIKKGVTSIGSRAFDECSSLTSITIPDTVTSIGPAAFISCDNLKTVHSPNLKKWMSIDFGDWGANPLCNYADLYIGGELLQNLIVPEGTTEIGRAVFSGCTSLTSVTIPASVKKIGEHALAALYLKSVKFTGHKPEMRELVFGKISQSGRGGAPFVQGNCIVYYPTNDSTWTKDTNQENLGGSSITWKSWSSDKNGWKKENGKYYYYINGEIQKGWITAGGRKYYTDLTTGARATGLKKIDGECYYFNPNNAGEMLTGLQKINGSWYYFDAGNGRMLTGLQKINGFWRYFDLSTGKMKTGLQKTNGFWRYFEAGTGKMKTDLQKINGSWYYFAAGTGRMLTGLQKINGFWRYFDLSTGKMKTGFQKINGFWRYFEAGTGKMKTGLQKINGSWYYFAAGTGRMLTGWQKTNGVMRYFDAANKGIMVTGAKVINGKQYVFYSNGRLASTYYVANVNSGKLHVNTCKSQPKSANSTYFATESEAKAAGYTDKCEKCIGKTYQKYCAYSGWTIDASVSDMRSFSKALYKASNSPSQWKFHDTKGGDSYKPQAGDIIVYGKKSNSGWYNGVQFGVEHVEICVADYDASTGYYTVIEGNAGKLNSPQSEYYKGSNVIESKRKWSNYTGSSLYKANKSIIWNIWECTKNYQSSNIVYSAEQELAAYNKNPSNYRQMIFKYQGERNWCDIFTAHVLMTATENPTGKLVIEKSSSNTSISGSNQDYSLAGAVYTIYSDKACTKSVGTLTINSNNKSAYKAFTKGTYYVKETTAPTGYKLDTTVYTVTVPGGMNAVTLSVKGY